jgi:hypothetical protein
MASLSLSALKLDCVLEITRHLSQRDVVSLHSASKAFREVYPREVTHVFSTQARASDYEAFVTWLSGRSDVRSLEVAVHPGLWNQVAPGALAGARYERVAIYPVFPEHIASDVWIPECDVEVSGFLEPAFGASGSLVSWDEVRGTMYFRNWRESPVTLPHLHPASGIRHVCCSGPFAHLTRIPPSMETTLTSCVLTQRELTHFAGFRSLELVRCAFEACRPTRFSAVALKVCATALACVASLENCERLVLVVSGDVPALSEVSRKFAGVPAVCVTGCVYDMTQLALLMRALFPLPTAIQYHVELVSP